MRRKDIEPGKVYGYSESIRCIYRYDPVVVVSTDLYMLDRYKRTLGPADRFHTAMTGGRASYDNAVGMLVVYLSAEGLARVDTVRELVSAEAAVAGINGEGRDIADGVDAQTGKPVVLGRYGLLTNGRYLHGDYQALQEVLSEAERLRNEYADQAEQQRVAAVVARNELADRLDKLGLTGYHVAGWESSDASMSIKVEDLERLLDLTECCASDPEHGL